MIGGVYFAQLGFGQSPLVGAPAPTAGILWTRTAKRWKFTASYAPAVTITPAPRRRFGVLARLAPATGMLAVRGIAPTIRVIPGHGGPTTGPIPAVASATPRQPQPLARIVAPAVTVPVVVSLGPAGARIAVRGVAPSVTVPLPAVVMRPAPVCLAFRAFAPRLSMVLPRAAAFVSEYPPASATTNADAVDDELVALAYYIFLVDH